MIDNVSEKMYAIDDLCSKLSATRPKIKVSSCSGSFDILHSGHISYLNEAKSKGDILVVFLNSDTSIRGYKGKGRPINSLRERAAMLAALPAVDYIVPFDELNPIHLIEQLKPEVFCNGSDWGAEPIEKSTVESYGGAMEIVLPHTRHLLSTTDIIKRVYDSYQIKTSKAIFLDRDGVLIVEKNYTHKPEDVEITEKTIQGLQKFRGAGWEIYVITNQSGIGRGYYAERDMRNTNNFIEDILLKHNICIKEFLFCPHSPEEICLCRKPKTALLQNAADTHNIILSKSWLIGDKNTDIIAGRMVNMQTIQIVETYKKSFISSQETPHSQAYNLCEAAEYITSRSCNDDQDCGDKLT